MTDPTAPDVRPGRSRQAWLIGLGVLVAVAGAVGIAVALSGDGGGSSTATTTTATTNAPDVTVSGNLTIAQDSCDLLDPGDIEAVYGSGADPGTPNASDGYCDFGDFEAIKIYQEGATATDLQSGRELAAADTVDLPELGGGAYQESSGTLTVLDDTRDVIFVMITGGSSPADYQRLVDLATLIVDG
jgi:hypothetical protein